MSDAARLAFADLQPEDILAALGGLGFRCDGRFLALNSYENRVYRVGIEDDAPIVTKFYRPGRWSDAAILEEHAFAADLAGQEIPVVPALRHGGATLHSSGHHRLAVYPCHGGRAPDLDDLELQKQLGRLVARIHLEGEASRFEHRPGIDVDSYGTESVEF
ncbi:MAG: phosphotransferase, partial [Proteobacteria bacterium]|nr:phosphotransferase [Pseudomonadota bacterium]